MFDVADEVRRERENHKANILKGFVDSDCSCDDIEKARSGVYADTAENRKKNRVGVKYGTKKPEESSTKKPAKSNKRDSGNIDEHAKNSSSDTLKKVIASKEADQSLVSAAKRELTARGETSSSKKKDSPRKKTSKKKAPKKKEESKENESPYSLRNLSDHKKVEKMFEDDEGLQSEAFAWFVYMDEEEVSPENLEIFKKMEKVGYKMENKTFEVHEEEEAVEYERKLQERGVSLINIGDGTDTYMWLRKNKKK